MDDDIEPLDRMSARLFDCRVSMYLDSQSVIPDRSRRPRRMGANKLRGWLMDQTAEQYGFQTLMCDRPGRNHPLEG